MSVVQVACTPCLKLVNKVCSSLEHHYQQSRDPHCITLYQQELDYNAAGANTATWGLQDLPILNPTNFIDIDSGSESGNYPLAAPESDKEDEPPAQWEPPP
ncbi:hypothetical protein B0H14DRAFT_2591514 [Mycena olivaceomarginata]|nr:hypothetical protein B0H14DRAFT_2591514 [Mycena olivaceomarginata]